MAASPVLLGRRLRVKVIALAGTMSSAPSQVSVLAFFAPVALLCACDAMTQVVANSRANSEVNSKERVVFMISFKQLFAVSARRD